MKVKSESEVAQLYPTPSDPMDCSLPGLTSGKNPPANAGDIRDMASVPGLEISPGGGHGNPLQYSSLGNFMTEESGRLQSMELQRVGHD